LPDELYFVTLTIVDWINLFTRVEYKEFIIENLQYCQKNKGLEIFEYVIMTNHIHLICRGNDVPLSDILWDFKTFTSKGLFKMIENNPNESRQRWLLKSFRSHGKKNPLNRNFQVWQNFNSPTILTYNEIIDQKVEYIHQNPVKAGIVSQPEDYVYSSANPDSLLNVSEF